MPLIRQIDETLQSLLQRKRLRMADIAVVENQCVKLIAFQEASNLSEELAAAHGSQIESFFHGKRF